MTDNPEVIEVGDTVRDFAGNLYEVLTVDGDALYLRPVDNTALLISMVRLHRKGGE